MPYGYNGRILHVNLSTGDLTVEEPEEKFYRKYMGGSAMGMYYLLRDMPAKADPMGPENILTVFLSVVTGVSISGQSRLTATAKSPLTGAIGDSQCGGFFPAKMKFAGFDGIVIKGQSEKPVYLWIHEGEAELRDASHLWGQVTGDVEETLKEELGDKRLQVLQIGPAGEKGVRFSALISMSSRAGGRTGMGAVMGSKRLKAIVVRGNQKPTIADKEALKCLVRYGNEEFPESDLFPVGKYGTAAVVGDHQAAGGLPTFNFTSGVFDGWEALDGPTLWDTVLKGADTGNQDRDGRETCYACVVRCKRAVEIKEGPYQADPVYGGPEYETLATMGSYCGVSDLAAVCHANELCNRYGLDTISCGATIAWAMEAFEKGLLTTEDTGGLPLHFGDADAMVEMVEKIAKREGFGDLLAEGSARAAYKIGRGTKRLLLTSKCQEAPAHMPRVKPTLSVIYATNPFGADHQSHEHDPGYEPYPDQMGQLGLHDPQPERVLNAEMVRFALFTQYLYSALDSLTVCQFVWGPAWHLYDSNQLVDLVQAVTGWQTSLFEIMELGRRRLNMLRAFNARDGIGRESDTVPDRFFDEALIGGPSDGYVLDREVWQQAVETYYAMAGWDPETGYPTRATLESLGIGWVATEIGV